MSAGLGVVVDVGPPPVLVIEGILVLVDGGEVELCAGAGVVDELFIELVDGTVPLPVLVRGVVELCASVVGGLFVGLVNSIVPLLVLVVLGVELSTDGDRYNVLFERLINGVANICELEFSRLFCRAKQCCHLPKLGKRDISLGLVLTQTAVGITRNRE